MNESILLVILAFIASIGLAILRARKPIASRWDAIIRFTAMLIISTIAHWIYGRQSSPYWYVAAILANTFMVYGANHFIDRIITNGAGVINKATARLAKK